MSKCNVLYPKNMKNIDKSKIKNFNYNEKEDRVIIQELRNTIVKTIINLNLFALVIPTAIFSLYEKNDLHSLFSDRFFLIILMSAWLSMMLGAISGTFYMSFSPRWVLWRQFECFLAVCYLLAAVFLLIGAIFTIALYFHLVYNHLM